MSIKKASLILAGVLVSLLLVTGCKEKKSASFFVPEGTNLIANVQVGKILADVDWEQLYAAIPNSPGKPLTLADALNQATEETGVDVRSFTEATIFATDPEGEHGGVILRGTFDKTKFIQNVETKSGKKLTPQSYEGNTIYLTPDQTDSFAFVGKDWLILGNVQAVKDALSVAAGKKAALSGPVLEAYGSLGSPMVKLAVNIPEKARQGPLIPLGLGGADLADIDLVTLSLNKTGKNLNLGVKVHSPNAEAAQKTRNMLEGMRLLLLGTVQAPEVASLLNKVKITQQDSWVNLTLVTTVEEVKKLAQSLPQLGEKREVIPIPGPRP